ncbi:hypothetical protein [Dactylosporangium salmoneum]|uniref:ABM domain-containing protein n=1 Tax=Dactylosporangium salmoneum TaxID=53361 RepID=A0ABN3HDR2_9ACTN
MSETSIIRYTTRPDAAEENQRLVAAVFAELAQQRPHGLRYAAFRLADGVTFVHVVQREEGGAELSDLVAFKEFAAGAGERVAVGPAREEATVVGAYNFPA